MLKDFIRDYVAVLTRLQLKAPTTCERLQAHVLQAIDRKAERNLGKRVM